MPRLDATQESLTPKEPQRGSRKVTVACNLPNGIVLRVCQPRKYMVPMLGTEALREVTEYNEVGRVTLKGNARPMRLDPDFVQPMLDKNGFALTVIDAELWEAFIDGQKNLRGEDTFAALINGCIYAVPDPDKAGDTAHKDVRSGLHPLIMPRPEEKGSPDPRMPRRRTALTGGGSIQVGTGER